MTRSSDRVEAEAAGPGDKKTVILAAPRGFCAGVVRAIETVEQLLRRHGPPLYVRRQIVHNLRVVNELTERGVIFVDSEDEVPEGSLCVFSAHGVSPQVRENAGRRNLQVVDATCPLVSKVHVEAQRFSRAGRRIILIGHSGHEEVEGTAGEAPTHTIVVESAEQVHELDLPRETPVAYLTQTTLSLDDTEEAVQALRQRFSDVQGPGSDDVCYASQNRQAAVKLIAAECGLVLVVGAHNSSNSNRLVEVARAAGTEAQLVPEPADLDESWLAGVHTVGVSAGASAPEALVEGLLGRLAELGYDNLRDHEPSATEDVTFSLPGGLRSGY